MNDKVIIIDDTDIKSKIFTVRDMQVMLDKDLALLYGVETRILNQAVKRNIARFPDTFRFQLTASEYQNCLRSQIVILEDGRGKYSKYIPYVFTEQGISMLSAVLRSETAIKVSVKIMHAFVSMRRFMANNATVFQRLDNIEHKQLVTDTKLDKVFESIEAKDITPEHGIFFNGQVFDAYVFVAGLVKKARTSIVLIDNYIDETVLVLLAKEKRIVQQPFTQRTFLNNYNLI